MKKCSSFFAKVSKIAMILKLCTNYSEKLNRSLNNNNKKVGISMYLYMHVILFKSELSIIPGHDIIGLTWLKHNLKG